MQELLKKSRNELKLKNYSTSTIDNYLRYIKEYLFFVKNKDFNCKNNAVKSFLLNKKEKELSASTINLSLNAVKFLYRNVLKKSIDININTAKKSKKLPVVLNKDEIKRIINSINNRKHKLMISLSYGAGLRVSETVSLKVKDINLEELTIHIKNSKGKKDRITVFPEKLKSSIEKITTTKEKDGLVFPSQRGGELTTRSLQKVFKKSLRQAGIQKDATFHSLRHSFATHLLEDGVDVRYMQELLGHQNIRTTQRYTQVTNPKLKNVISPL